MVPILCPEAHQREPRPIPKCNFVFFAMNGHVARKKLSKSKNHSILRIYNNVIHSLPLTRESDEVTTMIHRSLRSWRDFARECFCRTAKP